MMDDDVLKQGPAAVRMTIATSPNSVNLAALAAAGGRRALGATSFEDALAWTEAAIDCYQAEAHTFTDAFTRQGREALAMGLRVAMKKRFPTETPTSFVAPALSWLHQELDRFSSPEALAKALGEQPTSEARRRAVLARERLSVFVEAWRDRVITEELRAWFEAAGLSP